MHQANSISACMLAGFLIWISLLLNDLVQGHALAKVPHVSKCNYCQVCHIRGAHQVRPPLRSKHLHADLFRLSAADAATRQGLLSNCTECWGCKTQLLHIDSQSTIFFNATYSYERGHSSAWLFKTQRRPPTVVKVYCVPVSKTLLTAAPAHCRSGRVALIVRLLIALQKLSSQCGFTDVVTKVWVDKVDAVMPDVGYHINWHGLWMEQVPGVSFDNLLEAGHLQPPEILHFFHNKLNGTQVLKAAIFDLLTSQCDRHAQNIFIDEQGQIKLIDNEVALQNSWLHCGFNSILLPTSLHNAEASSAPYNLLDYRCYLPDGKAELGTDYPPQIKQCLSKISSMTVQQVQEHYDIPKLPALNLHTRAKDMLTKGFEWALRHGKPQNRGRVHAKAKRKCCRMRWTGKDYRCVSATLVLPITQPTYLDAYWEYAFHPVA